VKSKTTKTPSALNVLFVGNSFTARNNLPQLIAKLAGAREREVQHKLISAGGASLRMHWNKGDAQKAIATKQYDYVVLQEQSTLPVKNAKRMHENIRLFDEAIKSAGARTMLYMTWARRHEPQNQKLINDAYDSIGEELDAMVVPVGLAWEMFLAKHKTPVLHDADGSHPSLAGSYLAACVFYSVLFRKSPMGIESQVKGLTADEVKLLQGYGHV
jgi:hypothetical protein